MIRFLAVIVKVFKKGGRRETSKTKTAESQASKGKTFAED
jgi:hypothetical protein